MIFLKNNSDVNEIFNIMAKTNKTKSELQRVNAAEMSARTVQVENVRKIYNLYTSEFSGLIPDLVHYYFETARRGVNFWKSLLFEEIRRRDLQIGGVCQTRKLAVANKEWEIEFEKDSKVPEAMQEEVKKFIKDIFKKVKVVNFFTDVVEAQLQGVSTFEIDWDVVMNKLIPIKLRYIPNHLLAYDDIADQYKYLDVVNADAVKLRGLGWNTMNDRINLEGLVIPEVHPMKILEVHSLDGNAQNGFLNGCIDALIWAYLFKSYGLKDWSVYIERFAIPAIVGKFPTLSNTSDKNAFINAINNYGNLFKMTVPKEYDIALLDDKGKGSSVDAFERFVDGYWDKKIAIRVLGQSLTTGTDGKGSYALGKVHDTVREDIMIADMMLVKDTVNELIGRVLELNYSGLQDFPEFKFKKEKDIDYKKTRSDIMKNISDTGYTVSKEDIQEEFDFTVEPKIPGATPTVNQGAQYVEKFIEEYFQFVNMGSS